MKIASLILAFGFSIGINAQELPKFKDSKVNDYVKSYADFAKKYTDSNGNTKNTSNTLNKLSQQGKAIFKGLNAGESKKLAAYIEGVFKQIAEVPVKEKTEKEAIKEVVKNRKNLSSVEGIEVPKFKEQKLNDYVQEYAHYVKDYIALKGTYSEDIITRTEELTKKAKEITSGKISKKNTEKLDAFINATSKKIASSMK